MVEYLRHTKSYLSANGLTVKLAKVFGFCYGVERAINLAYASAKVYAGHNIYLLGEIIHNPEVNDQLQAMGIKQLKETRGVYDLDGLTEEDVVIVPAFGAEVKVLQRLKEIGCYQVDTTCGDVMSVWKRVQQYRDRGTTSIIHGKAWHEETKATVSQAISEKGGTHYLVVFTLAETDYVCDYIRKGGNKEEFLKKFEGAYSPGFDPDQHLVSVGVANQTTMMKGETEEVQRRFEQAMVDRYGRENLDSHFRKADTICGATQERQDALSEMLGVEKMNLLLVVGGYNSSNTSHLAEMGEAVLPTYFIKNSDKLISAEGNLPLRPAQAAGSGQPRLAARGQRRRRHHRRRVLPEQPARGDHPPPLRIPRRQRRDAAAQAITARSSASSRPGHQRASLN